MRGSRTACSRSRTAPWAGSWPASRWLAGWSTMRRHPASRRWPAPRTARPRWPDASASRASTPIRRPMARRHGTHLLSARCAYRAGVRRRSLAWARHAAGGQLVQATDEYIVTRNARIVLADGADGVRATMTAHWLIQLGWPEVAVLAQAAPEPETGAAARPLLGFVPFAARLDAPALAVALESDTPPALIDLASSLDHKRGHIPGAAWGIRARIGACVDALASRMDSLPTLVLTSDDGVLAHYAAHELATQRPGLDVRVLDGGTAAWRAIGGALETGIDQALTAIDDVWWKPYDHERGVDQAMKDYLSWEVGLVEQVEREGLARFRRF
ncbi:MAG: rhodanese-like domain-containing protein [Burkholderiaceae bacterium]